MAAWVSLGYVEAELVAFFVVHHDCEGADELAVEHLGADCLLDQQLAVALDDEAG